MLSPFLHFLLSASDVAIVTITDDDPLNVQFAESSYSVSEGTGEVVLSLTANGASTVQWWLLRWMGVQLVSIMFHCEIFIYCDHSVVF